MLCKTFACQPCYKRACPLRDHHCMTEIAVDDVYDAAVGVLREIAPDGAVRVL